ncbi:TIGR04222 domain-containing membrane protein [Streptomyces sp. NPDC048389]|uniref:TIGR04222 domain-containing membrane protein n=1 Tax=Streptomyces sp. NPDC048389 TaxID=3154622 RepID=UPI003452D2B5
MPLGMWWFIGICAVWLVAAALLLRSREPAPGDTPDAQTVALLRGGPEAAVTVALVALQQHGVVTDGRPGTVRTNGWATAIREPLQLAVHTTLRRPAAPRTLTTVPRVRRALAALHDRCARSGLLRTPFRWRTARTLLYAVPVTIAVGYVAAPVTAAQVAASAVPVAAAAVLWFVPRRTRAGRRLLATLYETHPLEDHRTVGPRVVMSVALHGDRALALHLPHFARGSGLLRAGRKDRGFPIDERASGGGFGTFGGADT